MNEEHNTDELCHNPFVEETEERTVDRLIAAGARKEFSSAKGPKGIISKNAAWWRKVAVSLAPTAFLRGSYNPLR